MNDSQRRVAGASVDSCAVTQPEQPIDRDIAKREHQNTGR